MECVCSTANNHYSAIRTGFASEGRATPAARSDRAEARCSRNATAEPTRVPSPCRKTHTAFGRILRLLAEAGVADVVTGPAFGAAALEYTPEPIRKAVFVPKPLRHGT